MNDDQHISRDEGRESTQDRSPVHHRTYLHLGAILQSHIHLNMHVFGLMEETRVGKTAKLLTGNRGPSSFYPPIQSYLTLYELFPLMYSLY